MNAFAEAPNGRFTRSLRWISIVFFIASFVVVGVLALRAPDCIGIGVSVLRTEDCTNRDTYYLLLAASAVANVFFSLLLFLSAYALEYLAAIAANRSPGNDSALARRENA